MVGPAAADNGTSLLDLLTTEPITNYCNAATDLNNLLEEISLQANDGIASTTTTRHDCERMLPGKIRRLRIATTHLRNYLTGLDAMAAAASATGGSSTSPHASDIREHAERTRRAVASILQTGAAGGRFHSNGIPCEPSTMYRNVNINLLAVSTVKASIAKLRDKIKES